MPKARSELVCVSDTPFYHVVSRCVRRTFLCGKDYATGRCYEHRRGWIEERIRLLASVFAIDIAAYAVMSNHYHLVVKLCPDDAAQWCDDEVLARWCSFYKGPSLVQRYRRGDNLCAAELRRVEDYAEAYRQRLGSLSWFMKCLNEPIARQANKEDECTGHFWESRFKSQALETEEALLSCMAYVDLNPVRAGISNAPETSDHTSIKERCRPEFNLAEAIARQTEQQALNEFLVPLKPLLSFEGTTRQGSPHGIPFGFDDYLKLLDSTGRLSRSAKRGSIDKRALPILERLNLDPGRWCQRATGFEDSYQDFRRPESRQKVA
ncbi:transposase [Marinobacter adhaerens]|uniref:Transposase n=1 Tax=Marinobacter adhaerens TaxID=1033846 RepID=A0A851HNI8_9GAMM|nr:transposase [Marinobacter adhaerens]NWN91369.1 transposase [Marinobacter adhaerens]